MFQGWSCLNSFANASCGQVHDSAAVVRPARSGGGRRKRRKSAFAEPCFMLHACVRSKSARQLTQIWSKGTDILEWRPNLPACYALLIPLIQAFLLANRKSASSCCNLHSLLAVQRVVENRPAGQLAASFLVLCLQPRSTSPFGWILVLCVTADGAFVTPPRPRPTVPAVSL